MEKKVKLDEEYIQVLVLEDASLHPQTGWFDLNAT